MIMRIRKIFDSFIYWQPTVNDYYKVLIILEIL